MIMINKIYQILLSVKSNLDRTKYAVRLFQKPHFRTTLKCACFYNIYYMWYVFHMHMENQCLITV